MKPSRIPEVLDLARMARAKNKTLIPLFTGAAGIGKSEICQSWVATQRKRNAKFGFIDKRCSYLEGPDFIGLPEALTDKDGRLRTVHGLPGFWPTDPDSEGLLLFEEPNRGTTAVLNCLMQILTDRKVDDYELPKGWIIAAAINPDSAEYDVATMDTALRNRFVEFVVEYDHNTFVSHMENANYCNNIQMFVKSGTWAYKDASNLGKDGKYISPRSWNQLNAAHVAGAMDDRQMHREICVSVLGKDYGAEFWKFVHDDAPVTYLDLIKDKKKALKKLKDQSKTDNYKGDMISVTVESIFKNYGGPDKDKNELGEPIISEAVMVEVAEIIPSDLALVLIRECGIRTTKGSNMNTFFTDFVKRNPSLLKILKGNIKTNNTAAAK